MQAIEYEARRQIEVLEDGGEIRQETRLFDSGRGTTRPMRSKEHAHDYRYFPDPDLLPLVLDQAWVDGLRTSLPELPDAKKARFIAEFKLSPYDAEVLVAEQANAVYFETAAKGRDAKQAANWVMGGRPGKIGEERGLRQVTDSGAMESAIDAMLAAKADKVGEYRAGKDKLFGFFVGQVMKATGGKANPATLNEILRKKLAG